MTGEVEKVFEALSEQLSSNDEMRAAIQEKREEADSVIRYAFRCVNALNGATDMNEALEEVRKALLQTGVAVKQIENVLPQQAGYIHRYVESWSTQLQNISMICAVMDALRDGVLTPHDKLNEKVGADIYIPLEHFLGGLCQCVGELGRIARNRVIRSDYETPTRCFRFASQVFDGLKQLNMRNDFLRKKYDGVKYEINHLETIMYDLRIRGLGQQTDGEKKRKRVNDEKATL